MSGHLSFAYVILFEKSILPLNQILFCVEIHYHHSLLLRLSQTWHLCPFTMCPSLTFYFIVMTCNESSISLADYKVKEYSPVKHSRSLELTKTLYPLCIPIPDHHLFLSFVCFLVPHDVLGSSCIFSFPSPGLRLFSKDLWSFFFYKWHL